MTALKDLIGPPPARDTPTIAFERIVNFANWMLFGGNVFARGEIARALGREDSYTTVLKQLQIMTERRFVWRDESARSHVYAARTAARAAESQVVRDLLDRVFGGSAVKLMMCALETGKVSQEELTELRKLVDEHRGGNR